MIVSHLGQLRSNIRNSANAGDWAITESALEQLPYTLDATASALIRIAEAESDAVQSVTARAHQKEGGIRTYGLEDFEYHPIAFAVDAYLDAARRTQNATLTYLSRVLRKSIPASLSDLVSKLKKGRILLPERVRKIVESYWSQSGETLKLYRDLSQHHAVVSSDGRVTFLPDGRPVVYLVLPNNPAEKSPGKLSFLDPRIDALPYAIQSYSNLYAFIFELTHLLLSYTTDPGFMSVAMVFKGPYRAGPGIIDGHWPIPAHEILSSIDVLAAHLKRQLDAELPRLDITPTLVCRREVD